MKRTVLFALTTALACAAAAAPTPQQLIARLGVQTRQALAAPRTEKTGQRTPEQAAEDAERQVAGEIAALIHATPGHASLTEPDHRGRTPLMLAVSGGHPLVVNALLTDAGVRQKIDQADADGETAWMLAQFAPGMTLVACQPGALTLERYPLLTPYLRRMSMLMTARRSTVVAIAQALQEAGAEANPEAARRGWLARCPNTSPELSQQLARGDLLTTLVNDALDRQLHFNKTYAAGLASLPQQPPPGMRFIVGGGKPSNIGELTCPRMPKPELRGALNWAGTLRLQAVAATRAGVVEVVDFSVLSDDAPAPYVVDHFRSLLVRTLAGYQCEGDHVFAQEFQFKVE